MAIIDVRWQREGRSVSYSEEGVFTVNETIHVQTNLAIDPGGDVTSNPLFFIGDPLFPQIGDVHPKNSTLRFKNIGRATQMKEDKRVWAFPLVYTSSQPAITAQAGDQNFKEDEFVDTLIAKKTWGFKGVQMPMRARKVSDDGGVTWSTNYEPTATTAGESIAATEDRFLPIVTYTRNELLVPPSILDLVGSVNSDVITVDNLSVDVRKCLCSNLTISEWKRDETYEFRTVTYTFMLNEDTWDFSLLNRGFYERLLDATTGLVGSESRVEVPNGKNEDGQARKDIPAASPRLLKYDAATDVTTGIRFTGEGANGDMSDVHYRRYRNPYLTSFGALGIS